MTANRSFRVSVFFFFFFFLEVVDASQHLLHLYMFLSFEGVAKDGKRVCVCVCVCVCICKEEEGLGVQDRKREGERESVCLVGREVWATGHHQQGSGFIKVT